MDGSSHRWRDDPLTARSIDTRSDRTEEAVGTVGTPAIFFITIWNKLYLMQVEQCLG